MTALQDLLTALGLAIAIEGALYALFPGLMKRVLLHVLAEPMSHIRSAGLIAAILGVAVVWMVRG